MKKQSARFALLGFLLPAFICLSLAEDNLVWNAIQVNHLPQQSDAHLIQAPAGVNFLIDTGQPVYAEGLISFLFSRGATNLEAVIITHAHIDHTGGLARLLKSGIKIKKLYFNPPAPEQVERESESVLFEFWPYVQGLLKQKKIPLLSMTNGMSWRLGKDMRMDVLQAHDGISPPIGVTDINDMSVIIMLRHGDIRFLLAGDMNKTLGAWMVKNRDSISIRADVLKAPHHGAESMPLNDFFEAVAPSAIVVPAPANLWLSDRCIRLRNWVEERKIPVYVNGLHGTITVVSDGKSFKIATESTFP